VAFAPKLVSPLMRFLAPIGLTLECKGCTRCVSGDNMLHKKISNLPWQRFVLILQASALNTTRLIRVASIFVGVEEAAGREHVCEQTFLIIFCVL
jgi:hypothetical protein